MPTTGLLVAVLAALALVLLVLARVRREAARLRASESRYRMLVERVPVGIYRTTPDGRNLDANPALVAMMGYPNLETFQQGSVSGLYADPADRERWQQLMEQHGVVQGFEARARRRDDSIIWVRDSARAVRNAGGRVLYYEGTWEDITARKEAEMAVEDAAGRLAARVRELEQRTRDMAILTDVMQLLQGCAEPEEAYTVAGRFLPPLFPESSGALSILSASGNTVESVGSWGSGFDAPVFTPNDCWALRRGQVHLVEGPGTRLPCRHIGTVEGISLCVPMMAQGEALGVLTLRYGPLEASAFTEATRLLALTIGEHVALALANLRLRETLRLQSIRDPLTGLFNRRYLEETLERELRRAARRSAALSIAMLDLDHFKEFNDTFGHDAGDLLLRELGTYLRGHTRGEDIVCRFGGEEFLLILPDAAPDAVQARVDRLREEFAHIHLQHRGMSLGPLTFSAGIAGFPRNGGTIEDVMRAADAALYQAKAAGRNRVIVAEPLGGRPDDA